MGTKIPYSYATIFHATFSRTIERAGLGLEVFHADDRVLGRHMVMVEVDGNLDRGV